MFKKCLKLFKISQFQGLSLFYKRSIVFGFSSIWSICHFFRNVYECLKRYHKDSEYNRMLSKRKKKYILQEGFSLLIFKFLNQEKTLPWITEIVWNTIPSTCLFVPFAQQRTWNWRWKIRSNFKYNCSIDCSLFIILA